MLLREGIEEVEIIDGRKEKERELLTYYQRDLNEDIQDKSSKGNE